MTEPRYAVGVLVHVAPDLPAANDYLNEHADRDLELMPFALGQWGVYARAAGPFAHMATAEAQAVALELAQPDRAFAVLPLAAEGGHA